MLICPTMSACSRIQELSEQINSFYLSGFIIPESEKRVQSILKFWQSLLNFDGPIHKIMLKKKKKENLCYNYINSLLEFGFLFVKMINRFYSSYPPSSRACVSH